jgi:hypothetical protein
VRTIKKKLIFPVIALAVLGLAVLDVNFASADDSTNPQNTIVQRIAEKFGLNQNDVQAVFDQVKRDHQAEMQKKNEERLNQLVTDGKITEEQKSLILNMQKELQSQRESNKDKFKDLTPEERKTQMEEERTQLGKWAKDNGIDIQYLMSFGNRGHGGPDGLGGPKPEGGDN